MRNKLILLYFNDLNLLNIMRFFVAKCLLLKETCWNKISLQKYEVNIWAKNQELYTKSI